MKSHVVKIRVPAHLFEWLRFRAWKENRTLAGLALHALIVYLGQKCGKSRLTTPPDWDESNDL